MIMKYHTCGVEWDITQGAGPKHSTSLTLHKGQALITWVPTRTEGGKRGRKKLQVILVAIPVSNTTLHLYSLIKCLVTGVQLSAEHAREAPVPPSTKTREGQRDRVLYCKKNVTLMSIFLHWLLLLNVFYFNIRALVTETDIPQNGKRKLFLWVNGVLSTSAMSPARQHTPPTSLGPQWLSRPDTDRARLSARAACCRASGVKVLPTPWA